MDLGKQWHVRNIFLVSAINGSSASKTIMYLFAMDLLLLKLDGLYNHASLKNHKNQFELLCFAFTPYVVFLWVRAGSVKHFSTFFGHIQVGFFWASKCKMAWWWPDLWSKDGSDSFPTCCSDDINSWESYRYIIFFVNLHQLKVMWKKCWAMSVYTRVE